MLRSSPYVAKGAIVANSDKKETFTHSGEVSKHDNGNQIIGGWFSVFTKDGNVVVDSDNEIVDMDSYNKVYIDFVKNYRDANFDHGEDSVGTLIDSILIDSDEMAKMLVHQITGQDMDTITVKRLGHFGSFQIENEADFEKAKAEKLMFSIEGTCVRVEVEDD